MISQDHVVKVSCGFMDGDPHGKSPPAKFGGRRHCGSGDIMFLVAEKEDSRCSRFNPPLSVYL